MNQNSKFALGGGGYVLYAPDFPRFQTSPGFSDEVHLYNTAVTPMYHLSFLDAGVPLNMVCKSLTFANGAAVLTYMVGRDLAWSPEGRNSQIRQCSEERHRPIPPV